MVVDPPMRTVEALLKCCMRRRCRDAALIDALVDAILEAMPATGERVEFEVTFKTRMGSISVIRDEYDRIPVHPECVHIFIWHQRCQYSTVKFRTLVRAVDCPTLPAALAELLLVFK